MFIVGTGVDIVEISRIKQAAKKWSDKFLRRIFTEKELEYAHGKNIPYQHLAARFAAKEAVLKAIGDSTIHRIEWTNVEILNDEHGKPVINLSGYAKRIKQQKNISDIIISMSHTRTYAVANAIMIKGSSQ
jgi:holo-[acyl-carrier protein] synthase